MSIARLSAVLLFTTLARAASPTAPVPDLDPDLPAPLELSAADVLLAHPPFTRIVSLEDTLQLTGLAYVEGRPVATFLNKDTKTRFIVSEEPNVQGWKIVEATLGDEVHGTEVHLLIEGEEVTMHYGDTQLSPGKSRKGSSGMYAGRSSGRDSRSIKTSSLLGENGLELYTSLSAPMRDKLKEIVHSHLDKHPEESMEEHSAYAQKVYAKIKAADQKISGSASSSSKSGRGDIKSRGDSKGSPKRSKSRQGQNLPPSDGIALLA